MTQAGSIALVGGGTTWQMSLEQVGVCGSPSKPARGKLATPLFRIILPVLPKVGKTFIALLPRAKAKALMCSLPISVV